jgi:hypothetical protein
VALHVATQLEPILTVILVSRTVAQRCYLRFDVENQVVENQVVPRKKCFRKTSRGTKKTVGVNKAFTALAL